jgi:hypothetical protein
MWDMYSSGYVKRWQAPFSDRNVLPEWLVDDTFPYFSGFLLFYLFAIGFCKTNCSEFSGFVMVCPEMENTLW